MKLFYLLTTIALLALPSCEKIRSLSDKFGKKSPAAPATPYTGEVVSELTESGYEAFSQLTGRVIIVDFYADWCGPCRKLGPILHAIAAEKQGLVLVGKINVDKVPALAAKAGVEGIPDVRIFRDGKQVDRFVGLPDEADVRQRIESHLKGLAPLVAEPPKPAPKVEPIMAPTTDPKVEPIIAPTTDPKVEPKPAPNPASNPTSKPAPPKAKAPPIQPMTKDWMPPGIQRR